jgi:RNA polymerase sigma factor (sigma-70 family)
MDALAATPRSRLAAPRRLLRLRSDAALAERFAEGDEAAFAVLFERHRASVVAVCIGVLSSRHDAEDAAQETFAALAVALRSSPPRELRAWLTRVARNAAIDLARRRRTRETVTDELSDVGGADGVISSQVVKDELESVIAGIRELPESQRTALLMRELAGHTYREIADLLETDEDSVRGLIARARIGLRQYREAAELPCATARTAIAAEPDGRRHDRTVRRHVRGCASCRAYRSALRDDARALRGLLPMQAGGAAGGSAVVGLAAKGALLGTAATQVTAACAVSACAVGGIALLAPALTSHRHPSPSAVVHRAAARPAGAAVHDPKAGTAPSAYTHTPSTGATFHHSTSTLTIMSGAVGHARARSGRTSATGSTAQPSAPARGRFTVPSGGRPNGASQPSNGTGQGSGGSPRSGPGSGSGRPSNGAPGSTGSSPPAGASGPGSGSGSGGTQQGSSQAPASPGSGGGTGDRGSASWPVFSGRLGAGEWSGSGDANPTGHGPDGRGDGDQGTGGAGGATGTGDSSATQGSDDGTSGSGSDSGSPTGG